MWTTLVSDETFFPCYPISWAKRKGILIESINLGNLIIFLCKNQLKYLNIHKKNIWNKTHGCIRKCVSGVQDNWHNWARRDWWSTMAISPTFTLSFKSKRFKGEHLQEPINSNDQGDVIGRKAHRGQHNYHGDQSSLGDPSCSNASRCRCNARSWKTAFLLYVGWRLNSSWPPQITFHILTLANVKIHALPWCIMCTWSDTEAFQKWLCHLLLHAACSKVRSCQLWLNYVEKNLC